MKTLLEDLWDNYQVEKSETLQGDRKNLHHEVSEKTNVFHDTLNDKQLKLFEELNEAVNQYQQLSDKECFFDGVHFGITLIIEALKT